MSVRNTKEKGARLERAVVNFCKEHGGFAMRAPASLGIDVIAVFQGVPYGIECTTEPCKRRRKVEHLLQECRKGGLIPRWARPSKEREGFCIEPINDKGVNYG